MKPSVYIETSIVSYLVSRPSKDVLVEANQILTRDWWDNRRDDFDAFISQLVLDEISVGEPTLAELRQVAVDGIRLVGVTQEVDVLADAILKKGILSAKAAIDVFHIAVSAIHKIDFLLTLNCKHIANPFIERRISRICEEYGYELPVICTPQELLRK
jgi:hypothetical protein